MVTALELYPESDEQAVIAGWQSRAEHIHSRLQGIPGLRVVIEPFSQDRAGTAAGDLLRA